MFTLAQPSRSRVIHVALILFALAQAMSFQALGASSKIEPSQLRTEYQNDPIGIDIEKPRFSWIITSDERNQKQSAYRIIAATSADLIAKGEGDLWDTGRVRSDETLHIEYAGKPLKSRQKVYWAVKSWDKKGRPSDFSAPAIFEMGLLGYADWKAKWIGHDVGYPTGDRYKELFLPPAAYFRKGFQVTKPVKKATLYSTALGVVEMRLNGRRVGDEYFTPGWTDYDKRVYYRTFDVTDMLQEGGNAIGAVLADGWYSGYIGYGLLVKLETVRGFYGERPGLLSQLEITYEDGAIQTIATDQTWRASTGPIQYSDILMGERYDARLEQEGWDSASFDDRRWKNARWRAPAEGRVMAYPGVPIRVIREFEPIAVTEPEPGVYIFDLGQNFAGIARLDVTGPAGTQVRMRFGEMLHQDGTLMTENLRKAKATDTYILKGDPDGEVWQPQFTYHGFRYVEVTGFPGAPTPAAITGLQMNSDTPETGDIHIYGDVSINREQGLLNQLVDNIKMTQYSNFFDVPTDCPQRDERLGWLGDAHIYAQTAVYNADIAAFMTKWMVDVDDAQTWYGAYPNFAPQPYTRAEEYSPAWMDAGVIIPYVMYLNYQDTRIIDQMWPGLTRFMQFQAAAADENHIRPPGGRNWGDWLSIGEETSSEFIATAFYHYDLFLMGELAEATGRHQEARAYREKFAAARLAFAERFINADGSTTEGTQTSYAMALAMGLYPEALEAAGGRRLAGHVQSNDRLLTTGFLGTKYLLPALSRTGHDDAAFALLTETRYPSWGYGIVNGATTIWERWNSYTVSDGFMDAGMNSFNHYGFGAVGEWMYERLGGISTISPGFKRIRIAPETDAPVDGVRANFKSVRGAITVDWRREADAVAIAVAIPANTVAEVHVPAGNPSSITISGQPISKVPGAKVLDHKDGTAIVEIPSGDWMIRTGQ